jgi:hypothetical protein
VSAQGGVDDKRTCAACSCTSAATTCANASLTTHNRQDCSDPGTSVSIDGACDNLAPAGTDNSMDAYFVYKADPNTMACAPTSATVAVQGSVGLLSPITICCP